MSFPWHRVRKKTLLTLAKVRGRFFTTHTIRGGRNANMRVAVRRPDPAILEGSYEAVVQETISKHLVEGAVFYDIGANIGFFSLLAARCVGSTGAVYAFEPVPANAASIRRSAALNGISTIHVFEEAVGRQHGRGELMLTHSIPRNTLSSDSETQYVTKVIDVAVRDLDSAIEERGLRPPSMVKIDVEGNELHVLQGMSETLANYHPLVLYEIDDATQDGLMQKLRRVSEFLKSTGYRLTNLPPAYPDIEWKVAHVIASPEPKPLQ